MKINLPNGVTSRASMLVLKTQKHSPTILFAVGVTTGLATVVTACRATLKVEDIIVDAQKKKANMAEGRALQLANYDEKAYNRDLVVLYTQTSVKFAKLYGPAFILGVTSVACLTQSHRILTNRNAALGAAYAAVDKAFNQYRGRVIEEHGEEKDREYRFGKETSTQVVETKNGPKKVQRTHAGDGGTVYARFFGEDNFNYTASAPEYNVAFLRGVQTFANQRLQAKGHLFLNDVYRDLGMEDSKEGSIVGWIAKEGDVIDFGIWHDSQMLRFHEFVLGREGIWLDFANAHLIWDRI